MCRIVECFLFLFVFSLEPKHNYYNTDSILIQYIYIYRGNNTAGPAYYLLHPQKGITICLFFKLTRPSKTGKESFLRQNMLSDLKFYTYDL